MVGQAAAQAVWAQLVHPCLLGTQLTELCTACQGTARAHACTDCVKLLQHSPAQCATSRPHACVHAACAQDSARQAVYSQQYFTNSTNLHKHCAGISSIRTAQLMWCQAPLHVQHLTSHWSQQVQQPCTRPPLPPAPHLYPSMSSRRLPSSTSTLRTALHVTLRCLMARVPLSVRLRVRALALILLKGLQDWLRAASILHKLGLQMGWVMGPARRCRHSSTSEAIALYQYRHVVTIYKLTRRRGIYEQHDSVYKLICDATHLKNLTLLEGCLLTAEDQYTRIIILFSLATTCVASAGYALVDTPSKNRDRQAEGGCPSWQQCTLMMSNYETL